MPPLAPRPFTQLVRRSWRLRIEIPRGYAGSIDAVPWYRRMRRRPAALVVRRCQWRAVLRHWYRLDARQVA
jgi:hypothetical protein